MPGPGSQPERLLSALEAGVEPAAGGERTSSGQDPGDLGRPSQGLRLAADHGRASIGRASLREEPDRPADEGERDPVARETAVQSHDEAG